MVRLLNVLPIELNPTNFQLLRFANRKYFIVFLNRYKALFTLGGTMKLSRRSRALACALVAFMCSSTFAGLYTKHKVHTDGYVVAGQTIPAGDAAVVTRLSGDMGRIDQGTDTSVIINLQKQTMVILDNKNKTYAEVDMGQMKGQMNDALAESGMTADQMQAMAGMMGSMMKMSATVKKTNETKKIKNWSCTKYDVTMSMGMGGTRTSRMWVTSAVKVSPKLYQHIKNFAVLQMPGMEEMIQEFEKIQGVPVLVTSQSVVMGSTIKRTEELLELKEMSIPTSVFSIPKSYKEGH